jgi:hypothetical protein
MNKTHYPNTSGGDATASDRKLSRDIQMMLSVSLDDDDCESTAGDYNIPVDAENIQELLSDTYDVFKHQMRRICKKENMSKQLLIYLYRQLHSFTRTISEVNNDIFDLTLAHASIEADSRIRRFMLEEM